jgi:hypothetical protein
VLQGRGLCASKEEEAMTTKTQLINGFLPPHTACPVPDCPCTASGQHRGVDHPVRFSCAMLRGWAMTNAGKEAVVELESDDPAFLFNLKGHPND